MKDEDGKPITKGAVAILMDGSAQEVNPKYSNVAKWPGDYAYKFYGKKKGKFNVELLVDGNKVIEGVVNLK